MYNISFSFMSVYMYYVRRESDRAMKGFYRFKVCPDSGYINLLAVPARSLMSLSLTS